MYTSSPGSSSPPPGCHQVIHLITSYADPSLCIWEPARFLLGCFHGKAALELCQIWYWSVPSYFSLVLPASLLQAHWENGVVVVVRIIALLEISELNEISPVSDGLNSEKVALGNDQAPGALNSCLFTWPVLPCIVLVFSHLFVCISLFSCFMFHPKTILEQDHLFGLSMHNI